MILNYIGHNQWNGQNFPNFYNQVISKDWDKIILFCQNEWAWHEHDPVYFPKLIEHCKKINKKIDVINGSSSYLYPKISDDIIENTNVVYWNTYWIGKTYQALIHTGVSYPIDPYEEIDYKYHFISMNHRPHKHRLLLIDLMAKHDLIENNAVSIHDENTIIYQWQYYIFQRKILEPQFVEDKQQHRLPNEYFESFAQLISESSGDTIFLSEKTAIALIIGKPFLVATQMHFHKFLSGLGFQLYEEIFDYSFDDEPDETTRYEMLLQNFIKLQSMPLSELKALNKKVAHKIAFNKKKAREIAFDMSLYPQIAVDVINYYKETGNIIDPFLIDIYDNLELCRGRDY